MNRISAWNKGKTFEETYGKEKAKEIKRKISLGHLGRIFSDEHKRKIALSHIGIYHTKATKKKLSLINMGNKIWLGKHHSLKSKLKMSRVRKGKRMGSENFFYGKHHSKETREKISKFNKGRKPTLETRIKKGKAMKKVWENLEYKKMMSKLHKRHWNNPKYQEKMKEAFNRRPNKQEQILIDLFKEHNLPFKYVGDFQVWFGGKNPDFINCDGGKHLIEFFGDYWHSLDKNRMTEEERIAHFKKYGFNTLVIWEHELKNLTKIIEKVKEFVGGPQYDM